ncbi:MAG: hypothetical protein RIC38_15050 [Chromatocurvus sp.]
MTGYDVVLFAHLLGWVFWLGTDIGVFLCAKYAERGDLSAETRLTILEAGMILDRFPRFSMPVVWLTGIVMMNSLGYAIVPTGAALVMAIIWLAVTWAVIFQPPGSSGHKRANIAQTIILAAIILGMGGASSYLLSIGDMPLWLALKWFAYVLVAITVMALERAFAPIGPLLGELAGSPGSDDLNARISAVLRPVYPIVIAIYAWTLMAAASGVSKVSL